jgi:hypothetical protein
MLEPHERAEVITYVSRYTREGRSPGPAAYNVKRALDNPETPVITMRGRTSARSEISEAPYYKLRSTVEGVTPITLHGRPSRRAPDPTPAGSYFPPAFGSGARKSGFAGPSFGTSEGSARRKRTEARSTETPLGKRRSVDETPGPGPGRYLTRGGEFDGNGHTGVQMKGNHAFGYGNLETPGPGSYRPKFDKVGPSAPKYGLHGRTKLPGKEPTPGYRDIGSTLGGLKFSMKGRADDEIHVA